MNERELVERARSRHARAFRVGGCVRDALMGKAPKDRDYVLCGIARESFEQLFPQAKRVGKAFPVYLLDIDGEMCEVSLARRERKSGHGYRGFQVEFDETVTIEEDLFRRDTSMNSMALELPEEALIDPYGGREDIGKKVIRAVSVHFMEDPVRALRAARQAAEHGFTIEKKTFGFMASCADELRGEPQERLFHEMKLALASERPSIFFRCLQEAGLLSVVFPEIHQLIGKTQPAAFHPEGDSYEHSLLVLDKVARETESLVGRFSGLVHDIGKGVTPEEMLPHHYGHEKKGKEVLDRWNQRMTLPKQWLNAAHFVIAQHMRAPKLEKPGKIVDLLLAIEKAPMDFSEFNAVIRADHGTLPDYLRHHERYLSGILSVHGSDCPEEIRGKAIGTWVRDEQIRVYRKMADNKKEDCI
ncbi:MAG: HD domain-containing protein [Selenomonadaceae bacterium]|nr:HD domain-containing protein [Selenomonadaceae bacterium]